ncbi:MAG: hypothetical protein ACKOA8_17385, partial [Deltaproteobacteria bacterium]
MKTRIIAGVLAALVVIGLIYWAPLELVIIAVVICSVLSYLEFDRLFFPTAKLTRQAGLSAIVFLTLMALRQSLEMAFMLFGCFYVLLAVVHVVRSSLNQSMQEVVQHFSSELIGYVYVTGLFGFIIPII